MSWATAYAAKYAPPATPTALPPPTAPCWATSYAKMVQQQDTVTPTPASTSASDRADATTAHRRERKLLVQRRTYAKKKDAKVVADFVSLGKEKSQVDRSIAALLLLDDKTLASQLPGTAAARLARENAIREPMGDLVRQMPEKSRHRAPLVQAMSKGKSAVWVSQNLGLGDSYRRKLERLQKDARKYALTMEGIGPGDKLQRIRIVPEEIEIHLDWSKESMVVKSGTETFKLLEQKQMFADTYDATYPQLVRILVQRAPQHRAPIDCKHMTRLHKNIESSLWIAQQPGFEEGKAAAELQRGLLRRLKRSGDEAESEPLPPVALADFDPSMWVVRAHCHKWLWNLLWENHCRFIVVRKPYECTICLEGPVSKKRLDAVLVKLAAMAESDDVRAVQDLQFKQRQLTKLVEKYDWHLGQLVKQRPHVVNRDAYLTQNLRACTIYEDFGAFYDILGDKVLDLCFVIRYADEFGNIRYKELHSFNKTEDFLSEDSFFTRAAWFHHLLRSGELDRWDDLMVARDGGAHFQNNRNLLF
jgi:hypothetical protein